VEDPKQYIKLSKERVGIIDKERPEALGRLIGNVRRFGIAWRAHTSQGRITSACTSRPPQIPAPGRGTRKTSLVLPGELPVRAAAAGDAQCVRTRTRSW
jgi:hypothetical protein